METPKNSTGSDDQTKPTSDDAGAPESGITNEPIDLTTPATADVIIPESETTKQTDLTTPAKVDVIATESKTVFGEFWQISKKDITIHHEGLLIHLRDKGFC